jgi:hypothetical protein
MIRELLSQTVRVSEAQPPTGKIRKLWPSEFGKCPRKAILGALGQLPGFVFTAQIQDSMHLGCLYEDDTVAALKRAVGDSNVRTQMPISSDIWSGKMDAVLTMGLLPVIIEHKATGDKNWDYDGSLPRAEHVCQLWLYGYLWQKAHDAGNWPEMILYYRAWGDKFAEFELRQEESQIALVGNVCGERVTRYLRRNLEAELLDLESHYQSRTIPDKPCAKPSQDAGCMWLGTPQCPNYQECWG